MKKLEIRAFIKYFCTKGMPSKEIHEDLMETPSYNTMKKSAVEFKRVGGGGGGGGGALRMITGLATPKMPSLMKMSRSCTPWLCVIGGETCEA